MLRYTGIVLQRRGRRLHAVRVRHVVRIRVVPSVAPMSDRLCLLLEILELWVPRIRSHRWTFGMSGMSFLPFGNVLIPAQNRRQRRSSARRIRSSQMSQSRQGRRYGIHLVDCIGSVSSRWIIRVRWVDEQRWKLRFDVGVWPCRHGT